MYHYRAVDRNGQTLYFMPSERRYKPSARRALSRAIGNSGVPDRIVIDKSDANLAGLEAVNVILKFTGTGQTIKVLQVKYPRTRPSVYQAHHRANARFQSLSFRLS